MEVPETSMMEGEPMEEIQKVTEPIKHPDQCPRPLTAEEEVRLKEILSFSAEHGLDVPQVKKKKRALLNMSEACFGTYKLGVIVAHCCKDMDLSRAYQTYLTYKENGIKPNATTFGSLMSLTAGFGEQGMSSGPIRTMEPPQDINAAVVVFAAMKESGFAHQESVYTAMIRCCCNNQRENEALEIYHEMQSLDLIPKLRTLSPLLQAFGMLQNDGVCFRVFDDLVHRYSLVPTEREYLSMLKLLVLNTDKRFYEVCITTGQHHTNEDTHQSTLVA